MIKRKNGIVARLNDEEFKNLKLVPGAGITDKIVFLINYFHAIGTGIESDSSGSEKVIDEINETVRC